ncbi:TetR/AcrR family transcriptional regulator [Hydrocarboniphaga effusa]|uniref:TetR/AcrR family transcriptional regulator n=1 Tax=Hydrocarboniphaga effusa TaxID=243629 RepID=UPI00398BFE06
MKRNEAATADVATTDASRDTPRKPCVRDRIFDTACDLFYKQGIRGVGVDAIANEAGTNKMSFYRSFSSKDELVAEYLRDSERDFWLWWHGVMAAHEGNPRAQCEALFAASPCDTNMRGCPMANAAVEIREEDHPALMVVRVHKTEIRARFRALAHQMQAHDPDVLGDGLMLLMSGSVQSRLIFPCDGGPAVNAGAAARSLLDAHLKKCV